MVALNKVLVFIANSNVYTLVYNFVEIYDLKKIQNFTNLLLISWQLFADLKNMPLLVFHWNIHL